MEKNNDGIPSLAEIFREIDEADQKLKAEWKEKLKGLTDVEALWKYIEEGGFDSWTPIDIVEIKLTDEKSSGYSSYQHARIVGTKDKHLYMRQEIKSDEPMCLTYYYIWQTVGMLGDDFSGFLLYPLNDGKFFKISYSC